MSIAIGLNSGSSFDGVDAVVIEIDLCPDGHPTPPKFIAGHSSPWPEAVARDVLRAFDNELSIFELCRLNYAAGAVYASCARDLMRRLSLRPEDVSVIGYDGQTLYQEPADPARLADFADDEDLVGRWQDGPYPCGLQIGEPAVVATACNVPTVTQFRPSDHALGGSGAPLMQYLDFVAFRAIGPVLTLNLGGIANCQLAHADRSRMMAFDTGPGNVMLDHTCRLRLGQPYDRDGETAARGRVSEGLLAELLAHEFFKRPPPRSAWRRDFGAQFADGVLQAHHALPVEDLLRTFTEFTAQSIARSLVRHVPDLAGFGQLIASGGGVRNAFLMSRIAANLPAGLALVSSAAHGIPPEYKEAVKFATLAHAHMHQLANNIPAASGASGYAILGKRVMPPRLAGGV